MTSLFEKLIPFTPKGDIEAFHDSYLLIVACYLSALFSAGYAALHAYVGLTIVASALTIVTCAFVALPLAFKRTGSVLGVAHAFLFCGVVAVAFSTYFTGGVVVLPWLAVIPLLGVLIVKGHVGSFWAAVAVVLTVVFTLLKQGGHAFPYGIDPGRQEMFEMAVRIGLPLFVCFLALLFQQDKKRASDTCHLRNDALQATLHDLRQTQERLVQQEKLASLGQLTAGVAHEIKNPLNFVNNFASLSQELVGDLEAELLAGSDGERLKGILDDLKSNAAKIEKHGRRADAIVRSMMAHARDEPGPREEVDLNTLVEEHVALAYHSRRTKDPDFEVVVQENYDDNVGELKVVPSEIGRVLLNLVENAFHAARAAKAQRNGSYAAKVWVETRQFVGCTEIRISDNGIGIPVNDQQNIFEPFYTTKPTGEGIGLGLSLSHDIVNGRHHGTLTVDSEEGKGSTFVVALPNPSF